MPLWHQQESGEFVKQGEQKSNELVQQGENRYSVDTWIQDALVPSGFNYNGVGYPFTGLNRGTLSGNRAMEVAESLMGFTNAVRTVPPAYAAQLVRAMVLSQARFTFRHPAWLNKTPR